MHSLICQSNYDKLICSVPLHLFHKTGKIHVLLQSIYNNVDPTWLTKELKLFILVNLDVGPTLARCCSANDTKLFLLAKKWRWPNVGPMLFNQPNANNFGSAILYVGPTLALRCKANTIKDVAFQFSSRTVQRFANVGPT